MSAREDDPLLYRKLTGRRGPRPGLWEGTFSGQWTGNNLGQDWREVLPTSTARRSSGPLGVKKAAVGWNNRRRDRNTGRLIDKAVGLARESISASGAYPGPPEEEKDEAPIEQQSFSQARFSEPPGEEEADVQDHILFNVRNAPRGGGHWGTPAINPQRAIGPGA